MVGDKLKGAVSKGDGVLVPLIGRIISQPGLGERVFGEAEVFLVKSALFMCGVQLHPSACEGVGTQWKEDLGQRHYDPDGDHGGDAPKPHAIHLPHDLYMPLYIDPTSPFSLRRDGGKLFLYVEAMRLFAVELEKRPAYYEQTTSTGLPMYKVGVHRLRRQVLVEYNAYCRFFTEKTACLFCGIVGQPLLTGRYNKYFGASPQEVAEVVAAAYEEGVASEMQVTGGVLPDQAEVSYFLEVGRAMRDRLGVETVAGSQAVLVPPQETSEIDALKEAGWQCVAFNMEVWDERLWPGMVPGKHALMPRDRWLERLLHAVDVFGKGQVASVLVAGIEPKRSFLEGAKWLAEHGIHGVPIPWNPAPGSAYEGHQTPTADWHLETTARILDMWEEHGLDPDRHSSGGLHYADLARMRRHLKEEQAAKPDADLTGDPRYDLSVKGRLPDVGTG